MAEAEAEAAPPKQLPPLQLAFSLPNAPDTRVQLHLTAHSHALVLFVTTGSTTAPAPGPASLGSFVYALPNQLHPKEQPLSTPLYSSTTSVEFATRLAKILAKRSGRPCYVGAGDVKFWEAADEGLALKGASDVVTEALRRSGK